MPLALRLASALAEFEASYPPALADLRARSAIGNPTRKACPIISVRKIGRRNGPGLLLMAESGTTT